MPLRLSLATRARFAWSRWIFAPVAVLADRVFSKLLKTKQHMTGSPPPPPPTPSSTSKVPSNVRGNHPHLVIAQRRRLHLRCGALHRLLPPPRPVPQHPNQRVNRERGQQPLRDREQVRVAQRLREQLRLAGVEGHAGDPER